MSIPEIPEEEPTSPAIPSAMGLARVGVARPCAPYTMGIDSLSHFTRDQLVDFHKRGVRVVGAYLENLTPEYRDSIFSCEMGIAPLTEASVGVVTADTGAQRGAASVRRALAIGVPMGCHILIDLESVSGPGCGDHANGFDQALVSGGYASLLYVGEPQPLGPAQLQGLRSSRYMRSCSKGTPEPTVRKWCVIQLSPGDVIDPNGARLDWFVVERDAMGGTPTWWWPE